jgi:hypothetical protein
VRTREKGEVFQKKKPGKDVRFKSKVGFSIRISLVFRTYPFFLGSMSTGVNLTYVWERFVLGYTVCAKRNSRFSLEMRCMVSCCMIDCVVVSFQSIKVLKQESGGFVKLEMAQSI